MLDLSTLCPEWPADKLDILDWLVQHEKGIICRRPMAIRNYRDQDRELVLRVYGEWCPSIEKINHIFNAITMEKLEPDPDLAHVTYSRINLKKEDLVADADDNVLLRLCAINDELLQLRFCSEVAFPMYEFLTPPHIDINTLRKITTMQHQMLCDLLTPEERVFGMTYSSPSAYIKSLRVDIADTMRLGDHTCVELLQESVRALRSLLKSGKNKRQPYKGFNKLCIAALKVPNAGPRVVQVLKSPYDRDALLALYDHLEYYEDLAATVAQWCDI